MLNSLSFCGACVDTPTDTFTQILSDTSLDSVTLVRHKSEGVWHSLTLADTP
jgi:hypothetical protein